METSFTALRKHGPSVGLLHTTFRDGRHHVYEEGVGHRYVTHAEAREMADGWARVVLAIAQREAEATMQPLPDPCDGGALPRSDDNVAYLAGFAATHAADDGDGAA